MSNRKEIIDGAARGLFVQAFANWSDENGKPGPGAGGDWVDYAPATPRAAKDAALGLVAEIEELNGESVERLYARAEALALASGAARRTRREPSPDLFGHYLAMESLGHGVSWFDDYPEFPLKHPHGEFHMQSRRDFYSSWKKPTRVKTARKHGGREDLGRMRRAGLDVKGSPPGPASGFGKEKTPADYRARIKWEEWAEARARGAGENAIADGHSLARVAYEKQLDRASTRAAQPTSRAGYAYRHVGSDDPMQDAARYWDLVSIDAVPAQIVGRRRLEGVGDVVVFEYAGTYYAQTGLDVEGARKKR